MSIKYRIEYIEGDSMHVQGNRAEIYRKYSNEWNIREMGKGFGNWILTKRSDILVNGKSYRSFVLKHYGKSKLTKKLVDKFCEDLENGSIKL